MVKGAIGKNPNWMMKMWLNQISRQGYHLNIAALFEAMMPVRQLVKWKCVTCCSNIVKLNLKRVPTFKKC